MSACSIVDLPLLLAPTSTVTSLRSMTVLLLEAFEALDGEAADHSNASMVGPAFVDGQPLSTSSISRSSKEESMPPRGSSLVTTSVPLGPPPASCGTMPLSRYHCSFFGPALLVAAVPKHSQVFPDVTFTPVSSVLYREIRKPCPRETPVDDQLLFVLVVDVPGMQQVGDDDLGFGPDKLATRRVVDEPLFQKPSPLNSIGLGGPKAAVSAGSKARPSSALRHCVVIRQQEAVLETPAGWSAPPCAPTAGFEACRGAARP